MTENSAQVLPWLHPLFGSALTLATVLAVVMNLLLHVGSGKHAEASTISTEG
jgi:xanthine/uracil permease